MWCPLLRHSPLSLLYSIAMSKIIDSNVSFDENTDGLVIQRYQEIPQKFIDDLKEERFQNSQSRVKTEMHRAASIPTAVIDTWIRQGFDFYNASAKEIIAKLKTDGLDYFITSDKV